MYRVTDQTRNAVWQSLLDAERYVRYYGALADKYRRLDMGVRFGLLAAVVIEAAVVVPNTLNTSLAWVIWVMVAGIAALACWDAVAHYASKVENLSITGTRCAALQKDLMKLWMDIEGDSVEESEVRTRYDDFLDRANEITSMASGVSVDEGLNVRCEDEAYRVLEQRYAA